MTPASRTDTSGGHILISGTGRAGTTMLVQYFTALGFDTGWELEDTLARVDDVSNAGLEHSLNGERRLPLVAKAPRFAETLGPALEEGRIPVRACIVPMRDLYSAAESRREVSRRAEEAGRDLDRQRGALLPGTSNPKAQERRLAVQFYKLVHTLVLHDVSTYFLRFPDFARGEQDLHAALEPLLTSYGVDAAESSAALGRVAQPDLIHTFAPEDPDPT